MKPIITRIEDRFDPPFEYYKHAVSGYVVRPLNWEGIWKDGFIFVGGNTMLNCDNEEDAKMIADTFNRFFELLKENKQLKLDNQKLDSCLTEYTSKYREESNRREKALEINEKIIEEYKINYGDKSSKLLLALKTLNDILKGDDYE